MQPLHNALTPPALVLSGLRGALAQQIPNLSFTFDPALDWSEAAKAARARRAMLAGTPEDDGVAAEEPDPSQYPLMAWNRSTLVPMAGRTRRNAFNGYAEVQASGTQWDLQAFYGQLTFAFKIYSRDILELEALEMGYVAKSLVSDITGFDLPVDALGLDGSGIPPALLRYDTQWDPLDPMIVVEKQPAVVFAIQGTATIRGAFLTGSAQPLYLVNTIDGTLKNMNSQVMESIVVHRMRPA